MKVKKDRLYYDWFKGLGAFSMGLLVGTCYGSIISTVVSFLLMAQ